MYTFKFKILILGFMDFFLNGEFFFKMLDCTKPTFSHQITNYNSKIALTLNLNFSFEIIFKYLVIFKLFNFILFFLS